ncbi:MAG: hypothetical protein GY755_04820 [Chloroflexi bacterium]|nr:hypothetical protein [Chloroflexota bacterium]
MQTSTISVALILIFLVVLYLKTIRPWQLHWGARNEEINRSIPGDDIVSNASFNATRAVTINAPPENIYPWIVQMGLSRAGWYSYDLLDNLARKSAESILPEFQKIEIGDLIPMSPDGKQGIWVKEFRENKWMLWWDKIGDTSWVWEIYPDGNNRCRLVTRVRMKYRWLSFSAIFNLIIEFFDFPMMRKCMLGIKKRAESIS